MENDWTKEIDRLRERVRELKAELESHAWEISPAMAQAKIDELNADNERLKAELAEAKRKIRELGR